MRTYLFSRFNLSNLLVIAFILTHLIYACNSSLPEKHTRLANLTLDPISVQFNIFSLNEKLKHKIHYQNRKVIVNSLGDSNPEFFLAEIDFEIDQKSMRFSEDNNLGKSAVTNLC